MKTLYLPSARLMAGRVFLIVLGAVVSCAGQDFARPSRISSPVGMGSAARLVTVYGKLPLSFETNRGQVRGAGSERVKFLARGRGYTLFLAPDEAVLSIRSQQSGVRSQEAGTRVAKGDSQPPDVVRLKLVGANRQAPMEGREELAGKSNYFVGRDPAGWRTGVPNFRRLKVEDVYPGIDLVYYGRQGELEYDWVVAPGADARRIELEVATGNSESAQRGAKKQAVRQAANGDLVIMAGAGEVRLRRPVVYQEESGVRIQDSATRAGAHHPSPVARHFVKGRYVLGAGNRVRFEIANYDRSRPLIIDPVLSYSTYLGGSGGDSAYGIAVDASGNAYVTGETDSVDFPTASALRSSLGSATCGTTLDVYPCFDAFVTKLSPSGSSVVYSTYLGGSDEDHARGIAVDSNGNAYVAGYTKSTDFPVVEAYQSAYAGGNCGSSTNPIACYESFVAKLNAAGSALVYSTYLGGSGNDLAVGIAVDSSGEAVVAGSTSSVDFPTTSGVFQPRYAGGNLDAFVTKLNAAGSGAVYSTFAGGSAEDRGLAIAVDSSGNAFVTGSTTSADFPVAGGFQSTNAGGTCGSIVAPAPCTDAFVSKVNSAGTALVYSSYLGGTGGDYGNSVAVDSSGAAYVAGSTTSTDFPVSVQAFQRTGGGTSVDAFAAKVSPSGSALDYATYLGGIGQEAAYGIAVGFAGSAYLTGYVNDSEFPVASPIQTSGAGFNDVFVTKLNSTGSAAIFSTFLGGTGNETGQGIAVDSNGDAYVAGGTFSTDFPAAAAFQSVYGGGSFDAFVAKISGIPFPVVGLSEAMVTFADQGVATTSAPQSVTLLNEGNDTLTISGVGVSGDFVQTNDCGGTLAPGAACSIQLAFGPQALGSRSGMLTLTDDAPPGQQTVALSGNGVVAFALSAPAQVAKVLKGASSSDLEVGAFSTFGFTGGIELSCDGGAPVHCAFDPVTLVPGEKASLRLSVLPQGAAGTYSFDVMGSSGEQAAMLPLTLSVADFSISAPISSLAVSPGQSAQFDITVRALNGFDQPVALACEGAPAGTTCSIHPNSMVPGNAGTTATVRVTNSTAAAAFLDPGRPGDFPFVPGLPVCWRWMTLFVASSLALAWMRNNKNRRLRRTAVALLLLSVMAWPGCGGGGQGATAGSPPGQQQLYPLTLSGTYGDVSHSVMVTLRTN